MAQFSDSVFTRFSLILFSLLIVLPFCFRAVNSQSDELSLDEEVFQIPSEYQTVVNVGGNSQYQNMSDALRGIPDDAGDVIFYISKGISIDENIQIPSDKRITSFTFDSEVPISIPCNGNSLYAGGIPLIVGKNLTLSELNVYGGYYAVNGIKLSAEKSNVIIYGSIGTLYGGGNAGIEGHSDVDKAWLAIYGKIQKNVYCGGLSAGKNSSASVEEASLFIAERAEVEGSLYLGGVADIACTGVQQNTTFSSYQNWEKAATKSWCGENDGGTTGVASITYELRGVVKGNIQEGNRTVNGGKENLLPEIHESTFSAIPGYQHSNISSNVFQEILVAPGEICSTLTCAMTMIDPLTTELKIKVGYSYIEPYSVVVPYSGVQLAKLTIDADRPVTIRFEGRVFFTNGVDLTLEKNVAFQESTIYAGGSSISGKNEQIKNASVTIHGSTANVYGGGYGEGPDSRIIVDNTKIMITGTVLGNVYTGGYANGGSESIVKQTHITISDTAKITGNLVFGGYAGVSCTSLINTNQKIADCKGGHAVTDFVEAALYGEVGGNIIYGGVAERKAESTLGGFQYIPAENQEMMDVDYPQMIRVGMYERIKTLQRALQEIRYPGKDVIIILSSNIEVNEAIQIPDYLGIESLTLESDSSAKNRILDMKNKDFYANGIPLTIGENIILQNNNLYGGGLASYGEDHYYSSTSLVIHGTANNIYAGGKADGKVDDTVSQVWVDKADISVDGKISGNLYAGGHAVNGGFTNNSDVKVSIPALGNVTASVYAVGNATIGSIQNFSSTIEQCFSSIQECSVFGSEGTCAAGERLIETEKSTNVHGQTLYQKKYVYCIPVSGTQKISTNTSLSLVDSVTFDIQGTVGKGIICGGNDPNSEQISVNNVFPQEICESTN